MSYAHTFVLSLFFLNDNLISVSIPTHSSVSLDDNLPISVVVMIMVLSLVFEFSFLSLQSTNLVLDVSFLFLAIPMVRHDQLHLRILTLTFLDDN